MSVLELFLYITLAITLQIALFAGAAFFRHWRNYQNLKSRVAGFEEGLPGPHLDEELLPVVRGDASSSWKGFRGFRVARKVFEDSGQTICSFHLVPADGGALPMFEPGQFLTFRLDIPDPVSGEVKPAIRCYSLSDRPGQDHYRVSIKRVPPPAAPPGLPPGLVSNHFHDSVKEGDVLQVRAPGGHFFLQPDGAPVVLIAGGIGITPMLSMLNTLLSNRSAREVWLFYGLRNSAEHVMKEHLETLAEAYPNFKLHVCYSRALPDDVLGSDYGHDGHVDISLLRQTLSLKPYQFYICGPRAMMETLIPALDEWGVPERNVFYESFGPASLAKPARQKPPLSEAEAPAGSISVRFSRSGKTLDWDASAATLLEFAENNGISVASGCRAGACGSCQATIEQGEVEYLQDREFETDPGCCLLCISRPKRDLSLKL
jgi:ferredoxin-NADP reductase